ncbi:MAG: hypothetical protein AAFV86_19265 [Pseudomonadota bacterium]
MMMPATDDLHLFTAGAARRGFAIVAPELSQVEPFASAPAGAFGAALMGQMARGHHLIAARCGRLEGYLGWGLADEAVATGYAEGRLVPRQGELAEGDWVVVMIVHADSPAVLRAMIRELRARYPGRRFAGLRRKPGLPERGVTGRSAGAPA